MNMVYQVDPVTGEGSWITDEEAGDVFRTTAFGKTWNWLLILGVMFLVWLMVRK